MSWITPTLSLLGSIAGAATSVLFLHISKAKESEKKFKAEKVIEFYSLTEQLGRYGHRLIFDNINVASGAISFKKMSEDRNERRLSFAMEHLEKPIILSKLHAPALEQDYREIIQKVQECSGTVISKYSFQDPIKRDPELFEWLMTQSENHEVKIEALMEKIIEHNTKLIHVIN